MSKTKWRPIIQSARANRIPGDRDRRMTRSHVDDAGRTWESGTVFVPSFAGIDNMVGEEIQVISINGQYVSFHRAFPCDRRAR